MRKTKRGDDKITEGLDGLRERLIEYKQMGAKFAKWRAVIKINDRDVLTSLGIRANAYALCQELDVGLKRYKIQNTIG